MTTQLAIVLLLLAAAVAMFVVGRPRMDAVALIMIAVMPFTGIVSMSETLAGFSDANTKPCDLLSLRLCWSRSKEIYRNGQQGICVPIIEFFLC